MRTVCSVPGCPQLMPCSAHDAGHRRGTTPAWRKVRRHVLKRDGYRCVLCGRPARDVHHVHEHALGGLDVPDNLISLCAEHHREQHRRMPVVSDR
jgi:5-methylcytosine-specific restriction endonuclease McrA